MKAFVFKSNNESVGKIDINHADEIPQAIRDFSLQYGLEAYAYVECSNRTWTLVPGEAGLEIREGRYYRPSGVAAEKKAASIPENLPDALIRRYHRGYEMSDRAVQFGGMIRIFGWIIGCLIVVGAVVLSSSTAGPSGVKLAFFLYWILCAAGVVLVFTLFGILVSAVGQILRSSLDTAIHTSPFLSDLQRFEAMDK